jgi:hypothetical protein
MNDREKAFLKDLQAVLKKHRVDVSIESDDYMECTEVSLCFESWVGANGERYGEVEERIETINLEYDGHFPKEFQYQNQKEK